VFTPPLLSAEVGSVSFKILKSLDKSNLEDKYERNFLRLNILAIADECSVGEGEEDCLSFASRYPLIASAWSFLQSFDIGMLYVGACKGEQELIANLLDSTKEGLVFAFVFTEPLLLLALLLPLLPLPLLFFCFCDGLGFFSKVSTLYASCNVE
jgi:hypothetical protein